MEFSYLKEIDVLKDNIIKENLMPFIVDYDTNNPFFFKNKFLLDSKIIIRTNTNKALNS